MSGTVTNKATIPVVFFPLEQAEQGRDVKTGEGAVVDRPGLAGITQSITGEGCQQLTHLAAEVGRALVQILSVVEQGNHCFTFRERSSFSFFSAARRCSRSFLPSADASCRPVQNRPIRYASRGESCEQ